MGLAYWGLAQKIWIIIEGVECQLLKVVSHQRGSAVEEGLQFLWVLIAWHLFPFVSLVKHYLDFGKPSWKERHQMFSSEWHNFMKVEVFVLCTCMYMVHTCTVLTHSYCMWKNFWNVRWKLVVTNVFQHNITVSFICALLIYLIKKLGSWYQLRMQQKQKCFTGKVWNSPRE